MQRKPFPKLSGRLYLFPALIPLAEILPWLLAAIGGAAGVTGFISRLSRGVKISIIAGCAVLALAATAYVYRGHLLPLESTTTIAAKDYPVAVAGAGKAFTGTPAVRPRFGELWYAPVKKQILSTPVVAQGLLLFGSYQGTVDALSLENGETVWSLPLKAAVFSLLKKNEDVVYAGEGLHDDIVADLTAIDPKDGRVIWQRGFKGHLEEPQAVDSGLIITGAGEGGLWALREKDGTVVWHSDIGHADVTPLVVDDAVYAQAQPQGSKDASVFVALDRDSGVELWRLPLLGQPWGAPVYDVDRRMILTTSARGQIGVSRETDAGWAYGIYRPRRKIVWQKELPNMAVSPEVFLQNSGTVIYSLKNGELLALESATGNEVWRKKVGAQLQSPAILLEGEGEELLAVTSFEGVFSVLRARDGQLLAHYKIGKSVTSSPVSHNDFIYVTAAHTVRAFGPVSELRQTRP